MKRALLVVLVVLLGASAISVLFAYQAPVKTVVKPSLVCDPEQAGRAGMSQCQKADAAYLNALVVAQVAVRPYQSYAEIAESFAVVALMLALASALRAPQSLKRGFSLPNPLKLTLAGAAVVGFGFFVFAETLNVLTASTCTEAPESCNMAYNSILFTFGPQTPLLAVLGLTAASLCLGVLRFGRGLVEGIKTSVAFGAASLFVVQLCLFCFDYREMQLYVTTFAAAWSAYGFYLVSNWLVLIVSAALLIVSGVSLLSKSFNLRA